MTRYTYDYTYARRKPAKLKASEIVIYTAMACYGFVGFACFAVFMLSM